MKVYVTGGKGFLGRAVCDALRARGADVFALGRAEGDLLDPHVAERLLSDAEIIVHLAADVGGVGYLRSCAAQSFHANFDLGLNVVRAACNAGVKRLVLAGTPCSYSGDAALPLREDMLMHGVPSGDTGNYGYAKLATSKLAAAFCEPLGIDTATVIPSNLYGPGDNYDSQRGHVVAALLRKAIEADLTGQSSFKVWGDGTATRDFVFVHDAAEAVADIAISDSPLRGEMYNLGSGVETSIRDLAWTIAKSVRKGLTPVFDANGPVGYNRRVMSIDKSKTTLGYSPRFDLTAGIEATVAWLRASGKAQQWAHALALPQAA